MTEEEIKAEIKKRRYFNVGDKILDECGNVGEVIFTNERFFWAKFPGHKAIFCYDQYTNCAVKAVFEE